MDVNSSPSNKSSKKRYRSKKVNEKSVVVPKLRRTSKRLNYCEDSSSEEREKAENSQIENRPYCRSTSVVETFKSEIKRNSSDDSVDVDVETTETDSSETKLHDKIVKLTSSTSCFSETSNLLDDDDNDARKKTDSTLCSSPKSSNHSQSKSSTDLLDTGVKSSNKTLKKEPKFSYFPDSSDDSKSGSSPYLPDAGEKVEDENLKTESRASSSPSSLELSIPDYSPDISDVDRKADNKALKKEHKYAYFTDSSDHSESESSPDLLDAGPIGNNKLQKTKTSPPNSPNSTEFRNSSPFPRWGQNVLKRTDSSEHSNDVEPHERYNTEVHEENVRNNPNVCDFKTEWEKWRVRAVIKRQIEEMKLKKLKKKDQGQKSEKVLQENLPDQKFSTLTDIKKAVPKGPSGHSEDNQKPQKHGSEKGNNLSELSKTAKVTKDISGKETPVVSTSLLGQIKETKTSNIDMEVVGKKHHKERPTVNITNLKFSELSDPKKAITGRSFGYSEDHQKNKSPSPADKFSGSSKSIEIIKEIPSKESEKAYSSLLRQIKEIKRSKIDDTAAVSKKSRDRGSNENIPNMAISPVRALNPKRRSDPNNALKENRQRTSL